MDSGSDDDSVALLAIKPRFAEAIIAGRKTVEFRKTRFSQPPRYVVLYGSTPIRQVVADFEVAYIKELTPLGLWRKFRHAGGIEYGEFSKYYGDRSRGCAIVVATVWKLKRPACLSHLNAGDCAPQSFRYLDAECLRQLSDRH